MFYQALPYYLSIGMSYEDFWERDPYLAVCYREAQDIKNERRNEELWLQGLYNYDALSVVLSNLFGGKGHKKEKYFDKPIELKPRKQTPEEARQIVMNQLDEWKRRWDKQKEVKDGSNRDTRS